jgi:hypothetical protein
MDNLPNKPRRSNFISITSKAIPCPPGTKSRARLPRGLESDPVVWSRGWALVGMIAALVVGLLAGRFLLP